MTVDVLALTKECIRFGVEPCLHSTYESAHRLLNALPCYLPRLNLAGDLIELNVSVRRCHSSVWSLDMGAYHFTGSFESCVTRIAQRCVPQVRSEVTNG
jgi:hypothetical protein